MNNINTNTNNRLSSFQRYIGEFEGYSCKFSPFIPNKIACSFSQYYGFVGNGRVSVFIQNPETGVLEETNRFNTNDGVFDIAWSEGNENQIASACADGSVKIWDISHKLPLLSIKDHVGEAYGISWNHILTNIVASSSMDTTVKLYDLNKGVVLSSLNNHKSVAYGVNWHPTISSILASNSADRTVKLWDTKSGKVVKTILINCEAMSADFNKYENTLAVSGADGSISIYDLRSTNDMPINILSGHTLTARKVQFSPHFSHILASVGYDMNVIIWDIKKSAFVNIFKHHREFAIGLDFNLFDKRKIATTAWDRSLYVFNWDEPFII